VQRPGRDQARKAASSQRDDLVVTVATDGAAMYQSELSDALRRDWTGGFTEVSAAQVFGEHLLEQAKTIFSSARTSIETGSSTSATTPGSNSRGVD